MKCFTIKHIIKARLTCKLENKMKYFNPYNKCVNSLSPLLISQDFEKICKALSEDPKLLMLGRSYQIIYLSSSPTS